MARLSVGLLGGFQVRLDSGAAITLPTRKAQALLAYLALPPGQAHPRDKLAALLWGGMRDESARTSLRQAFFAIRKALGESAVRTEGATIAPSSCRNRASMFSSAGARSPCFARAIRTMRSATS